MKQAFLFALVLTLSASVYAQNSVYKKDTRSQLAKDDRYNSYQSEDITKIDILKALEFAGVKMAKVNLKPFDKKYQFTVYIDEYVAGEKANTKYIFRGDNTYTHITDLVYTENTIIYHDYIDKFMFYLKEQEDGLMINFISYAMGSIQKLERKKDRESQFYISRNYSKTDYKVNEPVPLFVYASSWHDDKYDIERFCGVMDLSLDPEGTKELLDSSPHYYIVSYKVSE